MCYAGESSNATHGAQEAVDACRYYAGLIDGTLSGAGKEELLTPLSVPVEDFWAKHPLVASVTPIAQGSYKFTLPPEIIGPGLIVKSMEAALCAFHQSNSFKDDALLAVNLISSGHR